MRLFHSHENFPQSFKFCTKNILDERSFPQTRKFLQTKSFPQTNIFTQSKNVYANIDEKGFLKAKVLDPFNTTFYAKIFLIL